MRSVADDTDYSERQVRRIIEDLVARGYLKLEATDYGKYGTNLYSIQWDAIPLKKPLEPRGRKDKMSSPSNKEDADISGDGEDILPGGEDIQMSANRSVNRPENLNDGVGDARARIENHSTIQPITKAYSARRGAQHEGEQPKEGAPAPVLPPDDLADLEAIRNDPVVLALAEACTSLEKRSLDTLTVPQFEALAELKKLWGGGVIVDDIRVEANKIRFREDIQFPVLYLISALNAMSARPRAAPNGKGHQKAANGHGNGNGRAHTGMTEEERKKYEPGGKWWGLFHRNPNPVGA
jgi:hypothetical protein